MTSSRAAARPLAFAVLLSLLGSLAAARQTPVDERAAAPGEILISRQLAAEQGLEAGEIVRLGPRRTGEGAREFRIVGIYEPTPDPARLGMVPREARLHLPDLLELTGTPNVFGGAEPVDGINVTLADAADAEAFVRDLNGRLPGIRAVEAARAGDAVGTFSVIERFHFAIAAVTIAAATVFLLALTIMLVDERRETVGVLRLIGLPVRRILLQIVIEGLLVAGAGAAIGLVLALLSEGLINRFFQWRYDTALLFVAITPRVALLCVSIAVPLGAAATVLASWALLRRGGLGLVRR